MVQASIVACERCQTPLEAGDLRCSICGLAAPASVSQVKKTVAQVLRCDGCGAAVAYDIEAQAPSCAFCDSVMHVEGIEDPMEQTERYLPFGVPPQEAKKAVKAWLGKQGFFQPSDLSAASKIEALKPIWWVAWIFDARALVSWTADSNAGANRSRWAPHAGQVGMDFENILVSASRGLTDAETTALVSSYRMSPSAASPDKPPGALIEQFDVQRSSAREKIVKSVEGVAASRVLQGSVPGSSHRKLQVAALIERLVTRRYALPAYVLAYRYNDKLYRAVVSGQDVSFLTGSVPRSVWKVLLVVLLSVLGVAAVLGLIVLLGAQP